MDTNFVLNKPKKEGASRVVFRAINALLLGGTALIMVLLFIHIISLSLSSNDAIISNDVGLFPVGITFSAYELLLKNSLFWSAFFRSILRVIYGFVVNMVLVVITAYPLSKYTSKMRSRNFYMWFLFFTALFSGGVIPLYVLISELHLMNTLTALVLPTGVSIFNVILLLNFIRQLPKELLEAADLDGASELVKLIKIVIPCSLPSIATIMLFTVVGHWNSWFDGMLFSTKLQYYPLQSYLQTIVIQQDFSGIDPDQIANLNNTTMKTAQIVVATLPVLMIYPFFQKFFMTGIVVGSVKG